MRGLCSPLEPWGIIILEPTLASVVCLCLGSTRRFFFSRQNVSTTTSMGAASGRVGLDAYSGVELGWFQRWLSISSCLPLWGAAGWLAADPERPPMTMPWMNGKSFLSTQPRPPRRQRLFWLLLEFRHHRCSFVRLWRQLGLQYAYLRCLLACLLGHAVSVSVMAYPSVPPLSPILYVCMTNLSTFGARKAWERRLLGPPLFQGLLPI